MTCQDTYALQRVNLTIKKGMKLAIVGINGAGKTTLTKLLMRLYEPTEGRILLNGTDIREYDREKYFEIFAPVFQNVETFAFPIWKNVSLKVEEETDKEKVAKALERSGLDAKVSQFSNLPA
uniref:ATP-binding cassette domain-containing protein n=1 Tax=Acetatifactor sp. TaxID=1872090 RepID=UPI00405733EF